MEGWMSIHRSIWENWTWDDKPFSKGQAWIDLLLLANYKDVKIPCKGEIITCKRGDVNRSIQELSDRWGWSRKKTRAYLTLLEKDKMVTIKATTHRTTITIVKYNDYQDRGITKVTTKEQQGNSKGTAREQQAPINNKDNKDNKSLYSDFVNKMLSTYPGKKTKAVRDKRLPKILEQYSEDEILRAVNRYAAEVAGKEKQFILNESTFWNSRYVDYLDENYEETPRYNLGSEKYL